MFSLLFFFFNDTATTEIYTLSLHDALPIWVESSGRRAGDPLRPAVEPRAAHPAGGPDRSRRIAPCRSEEHTSELQSRLHLVCRLLLEKKKKEILKADVRINMSKCKID